MPAPGTLTTWQPPSGPGVRVDEGYRAGMTVPGSFDSLVAKIIVTGATRAEAIARSRRALAELTIEGMPTVLPFHRAVLTDPAYVAENGNFAVHTRWIETEFDNQIPPYDGRIADAPEQGEKTTVVVEVNGKRLEVALPAGLGATANSAGPARRSRPKRERSANTSATGGNSLSSPMQGTIVKVAVAEGDVVAEGDLVVVLEAMKMEQPLAAHRAGRVTSLGATVGETVTSGSIICEIVDAD
jgi:acetyl-CoA/propionyl-CoA carboxylase biotin carboxyl carrier protein